MAGGSAGAWLSGDVGRAELPRRATRHPRAPRSPRAARARPPAPPLSRNGLRPRPFPRSHWPRRGSRGRRGAVGTGWGRAAPGPARREGRSPGRAARSPATASGRASGAGSAPAELRKTAVAQLRQKSLSHGQDQPQATKSVHHTTRLTIYHLVSLEYHSLCLRLMFLCSAQQQSSCMVDFLLLCVAHLLRRGFQRSQDKSSAEMASCQVTFEVRGPAAPGEVFAICGSCSAFGNWNPQLAMVLQTVDDHFEKRWTATVELTKGVPVQYRYFKGYFLEPKTIDGPCEVIVHTWETHLQPRSITPLENKITVDDGHFGICNGIKTVDAGWLTCQTEIRLRLHYSEKPPVVISKKKFKTSRFRVKLTLEGLEKDDDEEAQGKTSCPEPQKLANTVEFSLISDDDYKCRHSQPECGYALQPDRWLEYTIQTMEPDNLELIFDFFEEDLGEKVVQGDVLPGHVGSACLLSSTIAELGKSAGVLTLAIMSRNPRKTIGKVRVDYIIIRPIQGYTCDMQASYAKYWKPRTTLDVGHRGSGNSTTTTKLAKVQENTIASLRSAASHGAAYVEFDVHLSKDHVPIVYHDLTCCMAMKKKLDTEPLELFEIAVKELTFDQLQLLKLAHVTALKVKDHNASFQEEENSAFEMRPFPSLQRVLESVSEDVGFNIEIKWISQQRDGQWDGNLSTYFDMNLFLDIILKTVLMNAGARRIVFSSFHADICTMIRHKQNKYPVLFLTQGESKLYPELMDLRSRTTPIAINFAQFENLLGINVHSEDLLRNPAFITRAISKGLVIFSWGDDANDPDNRKKLREYGVHGLIYDRIYDSNPEQPNIFQVEQLERLKKELPEFKTCVCPSINHFKCPHGYLEEKAVDNLKSVQMQKD